MAKEFPRLAPMERILRTADAQVAGPLSAYPWRCWPIPTRGFDSLHVQFLYSTTKTEGDTNPVWIGAPAYLVSIDAETAKVVALRPFEPLALGLPSVAWLGPDRPLAQLQHPDFLSQTKALAAEYDAVLPALAMGTQPVPESAALAAGRLAARFRYLAEPPLMPYYQKLGGWFFGWIAEVRR